MHRKFRYWPFLILFALLIVQKPGFCGTNPSSWRLESPKKGELVKSGELLIVIKLLDSVKIFKGSFQLFIDDYLITSFVKFSDNQISVLYTFPLKEGKHKLEVHVKAIGYGYLLPLTTEFYVNRITGSKKDSVKARKADFFELSGTAIGNYKQINTDGPGKDLAQAPPYVRELTVDAVARIGKVSFPVRYFNTSDALFYPSGILPSKNYLEYGIRYQGLELLLGDHNPMFDRLILSGIRVNGYKFTLTSPRFQLQIVDGTSQTRHEGTLFRYYPTDGIPPANLRIPDSTYSLPGIYERHITAVRASFGSRIEGSTTSLTGLRARDYIGSISYGANPADNIVIGFDENFVTPGNKMKVNAGLATSFYTFDRSKGPATESQVDSFYGYKIGFNPNDFRQFFTINFTTVKPGEPSSAGYFNSVFKSENAKKSTENLFTLDYRFYGANFISLGNPYVQNDLWALTGQDQLYLLNRKIIFSGRYTFQENNLAVNQFSTMMTQIISGNILLAPAPNLPQLNLIATDQLRKSIGSSLTNPVAVDDNALNLMGILSYNLKLGDNITGFTASYTKASRKDAVNTFSSNDIQIMNFGVTETLMKLNLMLDLHYSNMYFSNPENPAAMPLTTNYDGHIRYQVKKIKTSIAVGGAVYQSNATALTGSTSSTRGLYTASINCQAIQGLIIDLEGGMSPYTDLTYSSNNYQQNYGLVRLTYNFDFK
jgi:hypothetical protein